MSAVLYRSTLAALLLVASGPALAQPAPLGTAFTYQGRLTDAGSAADGIYDFELKLFDAASGGSQVASTLVRNDVAVASGLFVIALDFGAGVFTGNARWLEIGVRPGASSGAYTTLSGRQELTPVPHALYSETVSWNGVAGRPAGFADGVDNDVLGSLSCAAGEAPKWTGSAWACGKYQALITGSCPSGSAVRQVNADGTVVCETTAVHTSAVCCESLVANCAACTIVCGSGHVVATVAGPCTVTSDTGSCTNQTSNGRCCVCRP